VIPDGCVGLPTLAAVQQGIPVIAVRNNTNLMRNDLSELPFKAGQLKYAENYYEAAGIMAAMRTGVSSSTLQRPMAPIRIERFSTAKNGKTTVAKVTVVNGNGKTTVSKVTVASNGKAKTSGKSNGHANGHVITGSKA
jgi:hypothetical protein